MKEGIHPEYKEAAITCACGASFKMASTRGPFTVDVCSQCHPFFTGRERMLDTAGRVEKFRKKYEATPKIDVAAKKKAKAEKAAARAAAREE